MKRTLKNIVYHELIGLNVTVLSHSDKGLVGRRGIIVDETVNTLKILDQRGREITVPKLYGVFRIMLPEKSYADIDGSVIVGRPEDRLKKIKKS
ncbi:MAG: ribonuclease P protein subunit [Ignisphaera sp.]|nr:ribonuclease P protein subunit [Ignisphaera sp.]MCX8168488.1 ribonuclease P protein subunit [Ignisphaera sp.]MDW8085072.1 ribonuclease P protein subunit [Ignisphaera sp.]